VQLPAHAGTLKDLVTSLQKLHAMERSAFGLGMTDDPTPPPAVPPDAEAVADRHDSMPSGASGRASGIALVAPKTGSEP
jgi:hypothetical protein